MKDLAEMIFTRLAERTEKWVGFVLEKNMIKKAVLIISILFLSVFLLGNIYYWTDEEGIRHYSNIAPPLKTNVEELEELEESLSILKKIKSSKNPAGSFKVLKVYDGDTIQVQGMDLTFKIRMVGIDAPEIGYQGQESQPFCQRAKNYLSQKVAGKYITLKSYGLGGYNRQLAEVFIHGNNINLEMIRVGLAEVYTGRKPNSLDSAAYYSEEQKAKDAKRGMWVQGSAYKSPRQWRKEKTRK